MVQMVQFPMVDDISTQLAAVAVLAAAVASSKFFGRRLQFSSLDKSLAVSYLRGFPTSALGLWSVTEWNRLGVPEKLDFSTRNIEDGVRVVFYLTPTETREAGLAGLQEDGGFELAVRGNAIVARSFPGRKRRNRQEEVIWQRLVLQVTKGIGTERRARPEIGDVVGVYPCSMEKDIEYIALRRASDSLWKRY